ncbi:hypothetical protein [Roseateles sp.]|uniref:hypothetical protein n=1 Tax=Roseateles sp. TaxID=1971397 RepID=UPI002EDB745B
MIFAVETEARSLSAFASAEEAIRHCKGLDVEAAVWLFWDDAGQPLEADFSVPNKRGLFRATHGVYSLVAASPDHHAPLIEALDEVVSFAGPAPFDAAAGVLAHLRSRR